MNRFKLNTLLISLILLAGITSCKQSCDKSEQKVLNVMDYGAVGDGLAYDGPAIQKAIDEATEIGNQTKVLIPGGHKYLVGTLELKSDIDFCIDSAAELFISTDTNHYINDAVITANGAKNLTISGKGHINGRDMEFMTHYDEKDEWYIFKPWRPTLFLLTSCTNLTIKDISFGAAPFWGLHMLGCEDVLVDNITVRNNMEVPNCDGIDPDHCRNVVIQNCDIECGDDAIVVKATRQEKDYGPSANIHVKDCILKTQDAGVKIGTETTSDIHDIIFERCKIITSCRGIGIQLRDEGNVYNITYKDIEFVSRYHSDPWWGRGDAISFTAIPRTPETKIGSIHDIDIINVTGISENSTRFYGSKESRIKNIKLENVNLTLNKTTQYKGGLYDNRPTKTYEPIVMVDNPAIYIQYADSIVLNNVKVSWGENKPEYYTHALKAVNSTAVQLNNFEGEAAYPEKYKAVLIDEE
jgi:polygalacturonase